MCSILKKSYSRLSTPLFSFGLLRHSLDSRADVTIFRPSTIQELFAPDQFPQHIYSRLRQLRSLLVVLRQKIYIRPLGLILIMYHSISRYHYTLLHGLLPYFQSCLMVFPLFEHIESRVIIVLRTYICVGTGLVYDIKSGHRTLQCTPARQRIVRNPNRLSLLQYFQEMWIIKNTFELLGLCTTAHSAPLLLQYPQFQKEYLFVVING